MRRRSTGAMNPSLTASGGRLSRGLAGARGGALMAAGSMSCVQLGLAVSVHLFGQLGPLGVTGLRLGWAGVFLLVVVRPPLRQFSRRDLLACGLLGVVTAALMLLFMLAVARIPLGTASALEFLGPLTLSVFASGGGRRRWAVPAAIGVVLLTQPWHGGADPAGMAFALAAAVCWAAYILLTQHVGDRVTGLSGLAVSMPVAGVVAMFAAAPDLGRVTWPLLAIMLGLAVLHPVVPFSLEFLALRRLTASAFGTLMSLEPAIALLAGLLILGQVPGAASAAGIVLVVIAGVGATRTGARPPAPVDPAPAAAPAAAPAEAYELVSRPTAGERSG
jgi:inner membrane transporter RhtA